MTEASNKLWAYFWTLLFSTILVITFCAYSNSGRSQPLEARVRIECIRHGGTWGPMSGTASENTCDMRH